MDFVIFVTILSGIVLHCYADSCLWVHDEGKNVLGEQLLQLTGLPLSSCLDACLTTAQCRSLDVAVEGGVLKCQLNRVTKEEAERYVVSPGVDHYYCFSKDTDSQANTTTPPGSLDGDRSWWDHVSDWAEKYPAYISLLGVLFAIIVIIICVVCAVCCRARRNGREKAYSDGSYSASDTFTKGFFTFRNQRQTEQEGDRVENIYETPPHYDNPALQVCEYANGGDGRHSRVVIDMEILSSC